MKLKRRVFHAPAQPPVPKPFPWHKKILLCVSRIELLWPVVEAEASVVPALKHALACIALGLPVSFLFYWLLYNSSGAVVQKYPLEVVVISLFFVAVVQSLLTFFTTLVLAVLVHAFARLVGARMGWVQSFKAMLYGFSPFYLTMGIPVAFFVAFVWSMRNQLDGLMQLQKLSGKQAVIALAPVLLVALLMLAGFLFSFIA